MEKKTLLVKEPGFYRLMLMLALPVIIQNMITVGVNIMDTVMLGSFGEIQLSGSSLANDFINLFQIACMGVGGGASVLSAQFYGKGDYNNVKKTVAIMLRVILSVAVVCMVISLFFPEELLRIYTADTAVIEKGAIYLRYSTASFVMMAITMTLTLILRSIHDVKIPLYASIGSFFVNIFFNWVFIFGHFGVPQMQIAGAAIGTVLARLFELIVIGGHFFFQEKQLRFRIRDLWMPVGDLLGTYCKYCIPVLCSDMLLGIGNSMVSVIIGHIGTSFVAANSIVAMIQRLCTVMTQGIGHKLRVHQKVAKAVAIYVRDNTLFSKQWQTQMQMVTQSPLVLAQYAFQLFKKRYDWRNPIRSVTIQAINLFPQDMPQQIDLFCDYERAKKQEKLDSCVEKLRQRFGKRCIRNAVLLQELGMPMGNVEITMPTELVK